VLLIVAWGTWSLFSLYTWSPRHYFFEYFPEKNAAGKLVGINMCSEEAIKLNVSLACILIVEGT
jgi:hypothetical protein